MITKRIIEREKLSDEEKRFYDIIKKVSDDDNFILAMFTYTKKAGNKKKLIDFIKKYPEANRDDIYKEVIVNHYGYQKEELIIE